MTEKAALCHINDIPDGDSRGFLYNGLNILAIRQGEQLFLYQNSCPHLGIPLEWQEHKFLNDDNSLIQCSTHGALFTIDKGLCISGPCSGAYLENVSFHVEEGQVFLSL